MSARLLTSCCIWLLLQTGMQAACAADLLDFSAEVLDDEAVRLEWRVDELIGLAGFQLERSTDNQYFQAIGEVIPCTEELVYEYVDHPGSLAGGGRDGRFADYEQVYYYRLYFLMPDGGRLLATPQALEVPFLISTVSITWGAIKAMFR